MSLQNRMYMLTVIRGHRRWQILRRIARGDDMPTSQRREDLCALLNIRTHSVERADAMRVLESGDQRRLDLLVSMIEHERCAQTLYMVEVAWRSCSDDIEAAGAGKLDRRATYGGAAAPDQY